MSFAVWLAFTVAFGLWVMTPGPTTLTIVSYSLVHGRRAALAVVAGATLGGATWLIVAPFGIEAVLAASTSAFSILKIAGAIYFVFLGVRLCRARPRPHGETPPTSGPPRHAFIHLWLTTMFNPHRALFFTIFMPQFINPHAPLIPQFSIMAATVLASSAVVYGGYSLCASQLRHLIRTHRAQRVTNGLSGSVLMGQGIAIAALAIRSL